MEGQKDKLNRYATVLIYLIYFVGIIGFSWEYTRFIMQLITPFVLLLCSGIIIYILQEKNIRIIKWIMLTYAATFIIEVVGVNTGIIFGPYTYGETLGLKIFNTPLIIGLNWVFVMLGALQITSHFTRNKKIIVIGSAVLAVVFDFVMEPVAIVLDYWAWTDVNIPVQNYAAWFLITLAFVTIFLRTNILLKSKILIHYFIAQLLFFLFLNFTI